MADRGISMTAVRSSNGGALPWTIAGAVFCSLFFFSLPILFSFGLVWGGHWLAAV